MRRQLFILVGLLFGLVLAVSWSGSGRAAEAQPAAVDTTPAAKAVPSRPQRHTWNTGLLANGTDWSLARTLFVGITSRVSVASDGTQGNGFSYFSSISANGRYVAFQSYASNLVPGDTGFWHDIFVHDRQTGQTSRVSVASDSTQGDAESQFPSISADGRYVAFHSYASNLVPGDTNNHDDVFVHDRQTGQTSRVSVASDGTQGNSSSYFLSISADGRYVAFHSKASNLVPGDTNNHEDIFVHDRQTGQTSRVSVASDGTQANALSYYPSVSADGRYVAFESLASNLVPGDTNNQWDIFVHDRQIGQTSRVSVASDGTQGNEGSHFPSISADGSYVAFESLASNLVPGDTNSEGDVFIHDRQTGQTSLVSVASDGTQGDSLSFHPSISADGRYVAFVSWASNLVPGTHNEEDIFVHDRQTEQTSLVSVASDGTQGNGFSFTPSISADGRYVAFGSFANNLVPDDTNDTSDIFVHDRYIDLGFRPDTDGYGFKNWSGSELTVQHLVDMFGEEAVCRFTQFPSCWLKPSAREWRKKINNWMQGGHGFGMTHTAQRFFLGNDQPEGFGSEVPFDLPFSMPLREHIAFYFALQDTEPVRNQIYGDLLSTTPNDILNELQATLTIGDPPGINIWNPAGRGGHSVLPYRIEDQGGGLHHVYVYDNNSPGDLNRWIEFNINTNTWRSNLEGSIGDWEGDVDSHNIGLLPVSWLDTVLYPPQCPWCASNSKSVGVNNLDLFASGPVELLITDALGRTIGYSETGGDFINDIPGAEYLVPLTGIEFLPANFYLPITQTYIIDLHADAAGSTNLVQFGPGYAIGANNVAVTAATADQLTISNDGTQIVYQSSAEKEIDLFIAHDGVDESYQFTVTGSDLATNDVVELGADVVGRVLTLSHAQGSAGAYDLELSYADASGNMVTFISYDVPIDAQATQFIEFSSVLNDETVTVCTDLGSDGTIDECETRENESSGSVYLPIMTGMP